MKEQAKSKLKQRHRDRFIEDMKVKKFADATVYSYVREVKRFFERQCPDKCPSQVKESDFRNYMVHLAAERNYSASALKVAYSGVRFFFMETMNRDWHAFGLLKNIKETKKIPLVLERRQVLEIISGIRIFHARTFFFTLYSCGMRISECRNLKVSNFDKHRMVIRIIGKGNKEREIPLPEYTYRMLQAYWKTHRNTTFIFPALGHCGTKGYRAKTSISSGTVSDILRARLKEMKLDNRGITSHTFRHCYATHLLEAGVNIRQVQRYMGHGTLQTTVTYLHLTKESQQNAKGIINSLMGGGRNGKNS